MDAKIQLEPDTTLYPVPVVLITCGGPEQNNVFSLNRIASCNAEPPMLSISVRPSRASHELIESSGEFVVNVPWPEMEIVSDIVGTTTMDRVDKWQETGLTTSPASEVRVPLLAECPVNIECRVLEKIRLPSHTLFIAQVVALHADPAVLDERNKVDFRKAEGGIPYRAGVVRERPVANFRPEELLKQVRRRRSRNSPG